MTTPLRQAMQACKFANSRTLASGMAYLDALEQARCNTAARLAKLEQPSTAPIVPEDALSPSGTD